MSLFTTIGLGLLLASLAFVIFGYAAAGIYRLVVAAYAESLRTKRARELNERTKNLLDDLIVEIGSDPTLESVLPERITTRAFALREELADNTRQKRISR